MKLLLETVSNSGATARVPPVGKTVWDFAFVNIATQQSAGRWT